VDSSAASPRTLFLEKCAGRLSPGLRRGAIVLRPLRGLGSGPEGRMILAELFRDLKAPAPSVAVATARGWFGARWEKQGPGMSHPNDEDLSLGAPVGNRDQWTVNSEQWTVAVNSGQLVPP
jgi:hypothetical protein